MLSDQKVVGRKCYSIKETEKIRIPVLSQAPRPGHQTIDAVFNSLWG